MKLFHRLTNAIQSNIRYKIFFLFVLIICALIILFSLISYFITAQAIRQDYITYKLSLNQQAVGSLDENINNLIQQTYQIYNNYDDLIAVLQSENYGITYINANNRLNQTVRSIVESSTIIYGITLTNTNGDIILHRDKTNFQLSQNNISNLDWFHESLNNGGRYMIIGPHMNTFVHTRAISPEVISIAAALQNLSTDKPVGTILVDQNVMYFDNIIAALSPDQEEVVMILDEKGAAIYQNGAVPEPLLLNISQTINESPHTTSSEQFLSHDRKEWLLTYSSSPEYGWSIASAIPAEALAHRSDFVRQINLTLLLVLIVATFFISVTVSSIITSPLQRLHKGFEELKVGKFGAQLETSGKDEMARIIGAFNDMSTSMDHMIQQQFLAQINLQRAELESMQSQINPHFLYNTLNSIKALSDLCGDYDISKMIQSLAAIFRYNLNRGRPVVKLYDEIEHLRKYLFLQNIRYSDQLSISWEVDEHAMECEMVRFTLQPIAENIFVHAFKNKRKDCLIKISAGFSSDLLIIRIANNGASLTAKKMERINSLLSMSPQSILEEHAENVGIYNVNSRIKFTFGEQYGLHFEAQDGFTIVTVRLPIHINLDHIDQIADHFGGK